MASSKDPSARLRRAVQYGNLPLVRRLLHPPVPVPSSSSSGSSSSLLPQPPDVRNPDSRSLTSLSWAAIGGFEDLFEYLLYDEGHDDDELSRSPPSNAFNALPTPTTKDAENNTILHLLAALPHPTLTSPAGKARFASGELATRLASAYHDRFAFVLDWSNTEGRTALHVAAQEGHDAFVNLLIDLGADLDLPDVYGNTALHYASAWNHLPVCKTLVERGCRYRERNNVGYTAGDFAYSVSLQHALTTLARAQYDSRKLYKRTHTGLTTGSSVGGYSSSSTAGGGGGAFMGAAEEEAEGADSGPRGEEEQEMGPPPTPPKPQPPPPVKPPLSTALSSTSSAATDASRTPQPTTPSSPAPSTSSSRFHFHLPRARPALPPSSSSATGGGSGSSSKGGGPKTPPVPPPPSSTTSSPLRHRSASIPAATPGSPSSLAVFPVPPRSTVSATSGRSRTSSGEPASASASDIDSARRRGKDGKEAKEKWGFGRSRLVPPQNMKKSRWGK